MSIETDIRDAGGAVLTGGCHNSANMEVSQTLPYGVFYEITGTLYRTIHGTDAAASRLYQVDVFAATEEQAKGLALGPLRTAIEALGLEMETPGFGGGYNQATGTFCYITEYRYWET